MAFLTTDRLTMIETAHIRPSILGPMRCVLVNAWCSDDPTPTLIVGSLLLAEHPRGRWIVSHLLIEDEGRRNGFGSEIIRFYEDRLGRLDAAWVSQSGIAFARTYTSRFGPRPHWQIGSSARTEKLIEELMSGARNQKAKAV